MPSLQHHETPRYTCDIGMVSASALCALQIDTRNGTHPILDMTGRSPPRTHHFIIIYFADRSKKEVDVNYGRTISCIESIKHIITIGRQYISRLYAEVDAVICLSVCGAVRGSE